MAKKKKQLSEEQKKKMAEGRAKARAAKQAKAPEVVLEKISIEIATPTEETKKAAEKLFAASSEELSNAAVKATQKESLFDRIVKKVLNFMK